MKSRISAKKSPLAIAIASTALLLVTTSAHSQTTLLDKAKKTCTEAAQAKGFDLKEVASSETTADGGVKVVLSLTRKGANAKLTCKQSKEGKVIFGDTGTSGATSTSTDSSKDKTTTATYPTGGSSTTNPATASSAVATAASTPVKTYSAWLNPWLGLLIPLLGLPLLLLAAKGWPETWYPTRWGKKVSEINSKITIARNAEVVVRHAKHEGTEVRFGPGSNYQVTRYLENGTRVTLTGRQDNHWAELKEGGWIPVEHLDLEPHLV